MPNIRSTDGVTAAQSRRLDHTLVQGQPARKTHGKISQRFRWYWMVIVVLALVVIGEAVYVYVRNTTTGIEASHYQAVFLNNNQVYFGKLHDYSTSHPYLTDVWFIQSPTGTSDTMKTVSQQQLQLTQLKKAVHGPEDEMLLNKSQILFVENLTSNSQVTKLINSGNK